MLLGNAILPMHVKDLKKSARRIGTEGAGGLVVGGYMEWDGDGYVWVCYDMPEQGWRGSY